VLLRRVLLGLAVLAAAAVVGFAVYLFIQGYPGGGNPQSIAALAFPIALGVLTVVGLPVALVCAATWAGYFSAARRSRQLSPCQASRLLGDRRG
jgi:drug/metabolite transporter (DMT)-like permease